MKAYGGVAVYIKILNSALVGGEWLASRPGSFTPEERAPGTHWIEDWVVHTAGLGKISCPCREPNPGRPARTHCHTD
jgi:hypothetical protein